MDERTDEQMAGRTKDPCVLQDFVPFGAAAEKTSQEAQIPAALSCPALLPLLPLLHEF